MAYWRLTVKRPIVGTEAFDLRFRSSVTVGDDAQCDVCISTVALPGKMKVVQKRWGGIYLRLTQEIAPSLKGQFEQKKTWKNRLYCGVWVRATGDLSFLVGDACFELKKHEKVALAPFKLDRSVERKHLWQAAGGAIAVHAALFALFFLLGFFAPDRPVDVALEDLQKITVADAEKLFEEVKPTPEPKETADAAALLQQTPQALADSAPAKKPNGSAAAPLVAKKGSAPPKPVRVEDMGLLALQKTFKPTKTNLDLAIVAQGTVPQNRPSKDLDFGLASGTDDLTVAQGVRGAMELSSINSLQVKQYEGGLSESVQKGARRGASLTLVKKEVEVRGGLDASVIRQIIEERQGEVKFCYESALYKDRSLEGELAAAWTIRADGTVSDLSLQSDKISAAVFKKCVQDQIVQWKFPMPKGGGIVRVKYPFLFTLL